MTNRHSAKSTPLMRDTAARFRYRFRPYVEVLESRLLLDASVPGFIVSTYATIQGPGRLAFDSSGVLYTGRETIENASGTDFIGRIEVGGSPVTDYGASRIDDPDVVAIDDSGMVSGVAGSVVTGGVAQGGGGHITAVRPHDQSVVQIFGPSPTLGNPTDLVFDNTGRLLILPFDPRQVLMTTALTQFPTPLFTVSSGYLRSIAVDADNRIYTLTDDGILRIHSDTGNLLNGAFVTGLGDFSSLAFGPGGAFGTDLYEIDQSSGNLRRIDPAGGVNIIGTGFERPGGMAFGPDGALYVSEYQNGRILRISLPECAQLPQNVISWWPAEGTAEDIAGENHGTLVNGAHYAAGNVGQTFQFDGVDDYVSVADDSLNFGTDDFSIELWAQFDTNSGLSEVLISKLGVSNPVSGWSAGFLLRRIGSQIQFSYAQDANHSGQSINTRATIVDSAFHHIAVVRQGTSVRIWIDGNEQELYIDEGLADLTEPMDVSNTGTLMLGRLSSRPFYFFRGRIDEPSIYNRALSDADIRSIYEAGIAGKCQTQSDVAITSAHLSDTTTVEYKYTVEGNARSFHVGVYRSADKRFDSSDVLVDVNHDKHVDDKDLTAITNAALGSSTAHIALNTPLIVEPERPYFLLVALSAEGIDEENTENNYHLVGNGPRVIRVTVDDATRPASQPDLTQFWDVARGDRPTVTVEFSDAVQFSNQSIAALALDSMTGAPAIPLAAEDVVQLDDTTVRIAFPEAPHPGVYTLSLKETIAGQSLDQGLDGEVGTTGDRVTIYVMRDATGPDRDGDGFVDDWETNPNGVDFDGDGTTDINFVDLGADPNVPDIFVEIDWVNGFPPKTEGLERVVQAFADAPVTNVDGIRTGINLWLDTGSEPAYFVRPATNGRGGSIDLVDTVSHFGGEDVGQYDAILFRLFDRPLPSTSEYFDNIKAKHFDSNRAWAFHYALFAPAHTTPSTPSSGISERGGNDFMVTLGNWLFHGTVGDHADTFMHELGHNLGLGHGPLGSTLQCQGEGIEYCDPRYMSVMNYVYQNNKLAGVIDDTFTDYAREFVAHGQNDWIRLDFRFRNSAHFLDGVYYDVEVDELDFLTLEAKNHFPVITSFADISVNEGDSARSVIEAFDEDIADTLTLSIESAPAGATLDAEAGVFSWTPTDGPFDAPVTIRVTDSGSPALSDTKRFKVAVQNAHPASGVSGPRTGVPGQPLAFTLSAADPSPVDQAAGFAYYIDWGDGDNDSIPALPGNGDGTVLEHAYTSTGSFVIHATVTDKDGDISPVVVHTIDIVAITVQPDPLIPGQDALFVGGTTGNDHISIGGSSRDHRLNVKIQTGASRIAATTTEVVSRIVVYGGAGNDDIQVGDNVRLPVWLFGGDGDDHLNAGSGPSFLMGGDGRDQLHGGRGRGILVGGIGSDLLHGGAGENILVGGKTDFDSNFAALAAIFREWNSVAIFEDRVKHLLGTLTGGLNSSGPNGTSYLLNPTIVHDDLAPDRIEGGAGLDWYFANLDAPVNQRDNISSLRNREILTKIGGQTASAISVPSMRKASVSRARSR